MRVSWRREGFPRRLCPSRAPHAGSRHSPTGHRDAGDPAVTLVSGFRFPVSGFRFPVSGFLPLAYCTEDRWEAISELDPMCNRFAGDLWEPQLRIRWDVTGGHIDLGQRLNIAPTNTVATITLAALGSAKGGRELVGMRWGLLPAWKQAQGSLQGWTNARAETIRELKSFKGAFEKRRCLVPATGFYEWLTVDAKTKQPYHFRLRSAEPFAFAGVWETLKEPINGAEASVAIVTTGANVLMSSIHDRMPVILRPEDEAAWLDPATPPDVAQALLRPYPDAEMETYPVARAALKTGNQGPECLERIAWSPPASEVLTLAL